MTQAVCTKGEAAAPDLANLTLTDIVRSGLSVIANHKESCAAAVRFAKISEPHHARVPVIGGQYDVPRGEGLAGDQPQFKVLEVLHDAARGREKFKLSLELIFA